MTQSEDKKEKDELEELRLKSEEYLAGWKRSQADYQNLQKEYIVRMANMAEYASAEIIARLMPVIDNFELALEHAPPEIAGSEWMKGMFQIQKERDDLFKTLGIERVKSVGAPFDPHRHEAVGHEPSATVAEGKIIKEAQIGYKIKDRLIRPARVIVSKGDK